MKTIQKLKNNNNIVYHDNFNISNYQNDLLKTVSKNIRYSYLRDLSDDFKALNGIKSKKSSFSSQWQILARRLENFAPQGAVENRQFSTLLVWIKNRCGSKRNYTFPHKFFLLLLLLQIYLSVYIFIFYFSKRGFIYAFYL